MAIALIAGCIAVYFMRRWARKRQENTGRIFPVFSVSCAIIIGLPFLTWLLAGAPHKMSVPELEGFNFQGGLNMSPEFGALLLGLVLYTAAFVAEIVRAGIQAIGKGQTEAAMAIGLRPGQILNLVILPQALAGDYSASDEPDVEPDKEQLSCRGDWISRFCFRRQYDDQSDRAGHRGDFADHGSSIFASVC